MAGQQVHEVKAAGASEDAELKAAAAGLKEAAAAQDSRTGLSLAADLAQTKAALARSKKELLEKSRLPGWKDRLKAHPGAALGAAALLGFMSGTTVQARVRLAEVLSEGLRWDAARRIYKK